MNRFTRPAAALLAVQIAAGPALAADLSAGRQKAQMCATCHGSDGIATAPDAPNIAGDSSIYLAEQLKAFRDGRRQHQQMSIIAQSLSDEDIADLSAWFAAIEVTATPPTL
ncbi:cytochrome c [Aurantimonas sp. HBX-1]|uniref:c-type cytochrome n=1 Tax=Aurantimonas sp. HBX-1 TaxID=2906072 RepID=UPI001F448C70|nr:cytochrome c [Aurantimonas sp. HBX-1]UIJ70870.1 cytochrome c [Aurantimonas sp. HBX-1]